MIATRDQFHTIQPSHDKFKEAKEAAMFGFRNSTKRCSNEEEEFQA